MTLIIVRQSSELPCSTGPSSITPALLISASSRPRRSAAVSTKARAWASSVTSTSSGTAVPPSSSMRSASASMRSLRRAPSATVAPARASVSAVASPIPEDAPVIATALPESSAMRRRMLVVGGHECGRERLARGVGANVSSVPARSSTRRAAAGRDRAGRGCGSRGRARRGRAGARAGRTSRGTTTSVRSITKAPCVPQTANSTASVKRVAFDRSSAPRSVRPRAPLIFMSLMSRLGCVEGGHGSERRTQRGASPVGGSSRRRMRADVPIG